MSAETNTNVRDAPRTMPLWAAVGLAVLFGLFYAFDVWEAVGNLTGLLGIASALDTSLSALGWILLILAIGMPIALFALAFWLGRTRGALAQAALYLLGLAVSAAIYLDIYTLFGPANLFV